MNCKYTNIILIQSTKHGFLKLKRRLHRKQFLDLDFSLPPFPISPLFRTFAGSNFPNLERANNLLYHHPKRQGQQPERHQFTDS